MDRYGCGKDADKGGGGNHLLYIRLLLNHWAYKNLNFVSSARTGHDEFITLLLSRLPVNVSVQRRIPEVFPMLGHLC